MAVLCYLAPDTTTGETMISINEDLKKLIPPLSTGERTQLEQNIIAEGCRDPLVVWGNILIDGHNRFDICQQHGIEFKTITHEFASEDEAMVWIIDNQNGRRNLSDGWTYDLKLKRKEFLLKLGTANMAAGGGDKVRALCEIGGA